jgi:hypothetical protein
MKFNDKTRLFLILFVLGVIGVVSILLIDLTALVTLVRVPPGTVVPTITPAIKLLSLIQSSVLLAIAVLIGVLLSSKVGLSVPLLESIAAGRTEVRSVTPQIVPGLAGGAIGALSIIAASAAVRPFLKPESVQRIAQFGKVLPIPTRILYGGITEELLMRWGVMTLFVWIGWRVLQRHRPKPAPLCFIAAILLSSLMFGVGHLPVALMVVPEATTALVLFVIVANSAFGVIAGFLYWRFGLESAIIAHVLCHVGLVIASSVGAYF